MRTLNGWPAALAVSLLPGCGGFAPFGGILGSEPRDDGSTTPGGATAPWSETSLETYRLTTLEVDGRTDVDGDGVTDNHLVEALAAVDILVPDGGFDLPSFNARLTDNVANWSAVVVEAHEGTGNELHLDVLSGVIGTDGSVLVDRASAVELIGGYNADGTFGAGPGDLSIQVVAAEGYAPVPLLLEETVIAGSMATVKMTGSFAAIVPIDSVIDDVIAPVIPPEGWDVTGDGIPESPADTLAFIADLAPVLSDVRLPDGSLGITANLAFSGPAFEE